MKIGEFLGIEWEREEELTRKMLDRIPEDRLSWKPHEKSKTMGALSLHIASLPNRCIAIIQSDSYDPIINKQPDLKTKTDILDYFNAGSRALSKEFAAAPEEAYDREFTFSPNGKPLFTLPKAIALNRLLFNHMIHHRAQLSVYLRILDVPVPGMYGPSADE